MVIARHIRYVVWASEDFGAGRDILVAYQLDLRMVGMGSYLLHRCLQ